MPVVLQQDLTNLDAQKFKDSLGSPFKPEPGASPASSAAAVEPSVPTPDSAPAAPSLPAPSDPVTAPLVAPPQPHPNASFSPYDSVFAKYAGPLANDPTFLAIVAAGTKAESGWNASNTTGDGGHSWGLFQMHDLGAGAGMGNARLDPDAASAVMVPRYAASYQAARAQGLTGAALAAATAQGAERSADSSGSAYARAWHDIMGGPAYTGPPASTANAPVPSTNPTTMGMGSSEPTQQTAVVDPLAEADQFKASLGDPFAAAGKAIGGAASALGSGVQDALGQAQQFKDSLGSPFKISNDGPPLPSATGEPASMSQATVDQGRQALGDTAASFGSGYSAAQSNTAPQEQTGLIPNESSMPDIYHPLVAGVGEAANRLGQGDVAGAAGAATYGLLPATSLLPGAGSGAVEPMVGPAVSRAAESAQTVLGAMRSRGETTAGFATGADLLGGAPKAPAPATEDLISSIARYTPDIRASLDDFVQKAAATGKSLSEIGDTVAEWMRQNPPKEEAPNLTAALKARATPDAAPPAAQPSVTPEAPPSAEAPTPALDRSPKIESAPPAERYDPEAGKWVSDTNPQQTVTPTGELAPGNQNIPGRAGGAVENTGPAPLVASSKGKLPPYEPPTDPLPAKTGITPETMQAAHERINRSPGDQAAEHAELDRLVQSGADPAEIARFFAGVEGHSVSVPDIIRGVRTGSMAGGTTTEAKVLLSPIIQTAMRGPVGMLKAIVKGHPEDVPAGMIGGIQGLAEGSWDGLQTLKYGINYRAALGGSASGGFGFASGLDVLGKNPLQRALGTAAIGLVRTHGAAADVSAGIGRGAAKALGATPEAAAETGQQWAMRSGNYGTIGQTFASALDGIKQVNPALDVTGQILVPFYRVGYNAFTQGVERSPVGLTGTAADVLRAKLPASAPDWLKGPYAAGADASHVTPVGDRLANNMFGVGLAAGGFALASQGNITGEHPTGGNPKWSVKVAGNWMPLRWLGPAGEALAQSAILYEAARDGKGDVARTAELSAAAYVGHVHDETWLRNVGDILTDIGDARNIGTSREAQTVKNLQFQGTSMGKSFIPQANLIGQGVKAEQALTNAPTTSGAAQGRPSSPLPSRASVRGTRP